MIKEETEFILMEDELFRIIDEIEREMFPNHAFMESEVQKVDSQVLDSQNGLFRRVSTKKLLKGSNHNSFRKI